MIFRTLGSTGLQVSAIGLGTWQLGGEWGREFSQADADAIFDAAAACGVNLIDTAECYGDHLSERYIGDYLARHGRERWIIATKFGHQFNRFMDRTDAFTPDAVRAQLEASLKALRVEAIDLYQFHSGTDAEFENQALWSMLAEQKRAGKIRHLGVSILGKGSELQARQARAVGAEVLQVIYNRMDRRPEQWYFPHARRDHLGILARVPLASGFLSGKYRVGHQFGEADFRSTFTPERLRQNLEEAERICQTEVPAGMPMARWALAWCLKNPLVSAVIPGCKSPEQIRDNAAAVEVLGTQQGKADSKSGIQNRL